MLRSMVLSVANRTAVRKAVTGGLGRRVALRFVAGEELDQAVAVVHRLNERGFDVSLDYLGENVSDPDQARAAAGVYRAALERIDTGALRANVSVKLTQLGIDLGPGVGYENAAGVLRRAAEAGTTVTLDMEDHDYTDRTIDSCLRLSGASPGRAGVAIQAYLRRTPADLERLIDARVQVRLCKGAYKEPRAIAYHSRARVSAAYKSLATRLLSSPAYAMIATHDEELVDHAVAEVTRSGRDRDTFEFQMLYGVRREMQQRILGQGYRVRLYVPFGSQWYPYLMRRIAERPANMRFFAESLLRG